jgi:putative membrane protein
MIAAELRRLTASRMATIALLALMCVPVIYGALYLWANQNPYGKLDQIPAAIVVNDDGTTVDGKRVDYGDEVAQKLVAEGTFAWHRVSATTAEKGLEHQRYDFAITFPADFSRQLSSASASSPQKATVRLTTNDTNSYLASTIGQQAAEKIRAAIVQEVNREAASRFLLALSDIRSNLSDAANAAGQLADGASTAHDGSATLAGGLGTMATQTAQLPAQTAQLADGARQVADGDATVAGYANQAGALSQEAADAVPAARAQIIQYMQQQGIPQSQIDEVVAKLDVVGAKVTDGNQQVQSAVGKVDRLAGGARQVADGASQLAASAPALSSGIQQAAAGAGALRDGLSTLADGTAKLKSGLDAGVQQIPQTTASERAAQARTISDPVELATSKEASAGTYGAGLAPVFMALAAWIGIYALFLSVKPVSRRAITALRSPFRITLAGWLTPALLGVIQMVALYGIVAGVLHFNVSNPLATFGIMALASVTFASIILALNDWLGSVGQFLGLVLMVLQLVTAGGTFPWQTLPGPLAWLHHGLPMSYAVDGIRQPMYGGNPSLAGGDALFLVVWLVVALAITSIGVIRMTHRRTLRDLQPSLIG